MRQEVADRLQSLRMEKFGSIWTDGWVYGRLKEEFNLQPDELEFLAEQLGFKYGWNPKLKDVLEQQWQQQGPIWKGIQRTITAPAKTNSSGQIPLIHTAQSPQQLAQVAVGTTLLLSNPILSTTATAIGIAKTGTAIATLHGAAHTSATAAWIGFGSMKAGLFMMGALPVIGALILLDGICGHDHGVPLIDWYEEMWKDYEVECELEDLKQTVPRDSGHQVRRKQKAYSIDQLTRQCNALEVEHELYLMKKNMT